MYERAEEQGLASIRPICSGMEARRTVLQALDSAGSEDADAQELSRLLSHPSLTVHSYSRATLTQCRARLLHTMRWRKRELALVAATPFCSPRPLLCESTCPRYLWYIRAANTNKHNLTISFTLLTYITCRKQLDG